MMENEESMMITITEEAIKLAEAACQLDKANISLGAIDYYDRALLSIDEVLNKLPAESSEWKKLLAIRNQYDERMEYLREYENSKQQFNIISSVSLNPTATSVGRVDKRAFLRKQQRRNKLKVLESDVT